MLFVLLLVNFLPFNYAHIAETNVNVNHIVEVFAFAAPSLAENAKKICAGRNILVQGTSFQQMSKILMKTIDSIGSGYIGNSNELEDIAESFFPNSELQYGNITLSKRFVNEIIGSLKKISKGWNNAYTINIQVADIINKNTDLMMVMDNSIPESIVTAFVDAQKPMIRSFSNMAKQSKEVCRHLLTIAHNPHNLYGVEFSHLATFFHETVKPLEIAAQVLHTFHKTLLGFEYPIVADFLSAFHTELVGLGEPYHELLDAANKLNDYFSSSSSSM